MAGGLALALSGGGLAWSLSNEQNHDSANESSGITTLALPSTGADSVTASSVVDCVNERGICVLEGALDDQAVRTCHRAGMFRFADCDALRTRARSRKNADEMDSPGRMCGDFFQSTFGRYAETNMNPAHITTSPSP